MTAEKKIAISFLEMVASAQIEEAFKVYVAEDFKHHNPYFKGDAKSLKDAMLEDAQNNPEKELKILRSLADEEFIAIHSHVKQNPADLGFVFVHFFKFKDQKIIELWDVGQEIPDEITNENGML
ncbi:nuclear transport factor 2 family protein [Marivirga harenae]|uniref:nuclear transport factor 2 family protein n=1 Tax=Marivirga harenae TaxID=2010992 RepID=UPI0026E026D6|nr:nuclear transport factor 2 family protein [Marivirga harenae]WKV13012.1 nuclear transport factor 2 family protein [Marivirga harenae]